MVGASLLDCLDGTSKTSHEAAAHRLAGHTMAESMAGVSLTLTPSDDQDRLVGAPSFTASGTVIEKAMDHGYNNVQA
ncbi:hypothetical protein [Streptomyces sp. GS7]|uniref:hypothetical protein n=1 Tax=Streptomyces sp. GS7 TaxID=2692234 RepID=UPI00131840DD|nr:hypothetical protein [Streptomyces sp. GS7]QHC22992.1 hypothetical protein GR130_17780 [Streptomyces sp. GS7]